MMKKTSTESSPDTIISELHRIREEIVNAFGGDLRRLTDDARRRQAASGQPIWHGAKTECQATELPEDRH